MGLIVATALAAFNVRVSCLISARNAADVQSSSFLIAMWTSLPCCLTPGHIRHWFTMFWI